MPKYFHPFIAQRMNWPRSNRPSNGRWATAGWCRCYPFLCTKCCNSKFLDPESSSSWVSLWGRFRPGRPASPVYCPTPKSVFRPIEASPTSCATRSCKKVTFYYACHINKRGLIFAAVQQVMGNVAWDSIPFECLAANSLTITINVLSHRMLTGKLPCIAC